MGKEKKRDKFEVLDGKIVLEKFNTVIARY